MRILVAGICIFSFVLLYSCQRKQEAQKGEILSTAKMQLVLWDMLQADAFTENFIKRDSSKNVLVENAALQKKIFELYKISREDFYTSYNYYTTHPDVMKTILDSISVKAERDRNKLMKEKYGAKKVLTGIK
jgi:hypothetical protein